MVVLEIFSVPSAWISSSMAIIHRFFSFSGVWKASRILLVLLKSNVRATDVMQQFCYLSFHPSYSVLSMIPSIGKTFHLSFALTYYIFQLWHLFCLIFFSIYILLIEFHFCILIDFLNLYNWLNFLVIHQEIILVSFLNILMTVILNFCLEAHLNNSYWDHYSRIGSFFRVHFIFIFHVAWTFAFGHVHLWLHHLLSFVIVHLSSFRICIVEEGLDCMKAKISSFSVWWGV